ncbi:MAG: dihydrofolate reductase family protein [Bacteroidota bacterium]
MRKIIYYVASSLDGYIAGENEDISLFAMTGAGVDQYRKDLLEFDTVIMGRKTYEFGYQYGLKAGQKAYPHMKHYIFSDTLVFEHADEGVYTEKLNLARIDALKAEAGSDIYLCGGGEFAAWLLDHGKIDVLKLKLNPILLGSGTALFGQSKTAGKLKLIDAMKYEDGLQILTYDVL